MNLKEVKGILKVAFSNRNYLYKGFLLALKIPLIAIVTNPIAWGYSLRVGVGAMKGEKKLSNWKDPGRLWIDFVVSGFLMALYFIVAALIVFGIRFVSNGFLFDSFGPDILHKFVEAERNNVALGIPVWQQILISFVFLPFVYIMPVALINWFSCRKLDTFFNFSLVWGRAFRKEYLSAFIVSTIATLIIPICFWLLSFAFDYEKYIEDTIRGVADTSILLTMVIFVILAFFIIVTGVFSYGISLFTSILYGRALRKIDKQDFAAGNKKAKVLYQNELETVEAGPKAPGKGR